MRTLILTSGEMAQLVGMATAVDAVEAAFRAHARGEAAMPPKVYLDFPEHEGDLRAMPASLGQRAGLKWVNSHPRNPERHGLPTVMGVYLLSDPATAQLLAIMDGTLLTAMRTGAATGVASRHLGPRGPGLLGLIGCGAQAPHFLAAHRVLFEGIEWVAADVDPACAQAFVAEHGGRAVSVEEAAGADIVCIATPSHTPVIQRGWIKPGAHINAMGADAPGKQELDPQILKDARVFIDDWEQALHSGEVNVPLSAGELSRDDIAGTLGAVVAGDCVGREAKELTVFDSTGLAVQDVAVASAFYEAAMARGVGRRIDLRA